MRRNDGLTARDRQIAALLASGLTYREVGERLKVSERTVQRAMTRPEVRAEVDAMRGRAIEAGLGLLCENFTTAVTELVGLVRVGSAADSVRLGAARLVIEAALKVREHVTLTREITELRGMFDEPAGGTEPPSEDRGKPEDEPPGPDGTEGGPGGGSDDGEGHPG